MALTLLPRAAIRWMPIPMNAERTLVLPLEGDLPDAHLLALVAKVARLRDAAIDGVLVVSPQILQAASLPLAVEVERFTTSERVLVRRTVERSVARREHAAQLLLAECAQPHAVRVSCSRYLGDLPEMLIARPDADVLLLPRMSFASTLRGLRNPDQLEELALYCDAAVSDFVRSVLPLVHRLCFEHGVRQLTLLYEAAPAREVDSLLALHLPTRQWLVDTRGVHWVRHLHLGARSLLLLPAGVALNSGSASLLQLLRDTRGPVLLLPPSLHAVS